MTSQLKIKQFSIVAEPTSGFSVFTKKFEQTIILLFLSYLVLEVAPQTFSILQYLAIFLPLLFWYKQLLLALWLLQYFAQNSTEETILAALLQRFLDCLFCRIFIKSPKKQRLFFYLNLFCLCHFFLIMFLNLVAFSHSVLVSQFNIDRCLQDSHAVRDGVICNISQWLKLLTCVKQGSGLDIQEIWIHLYNSTVYYISFVSQCMYQNHFIMTIILLTLLLHLL